MSAQNSHNISLIVNLSQNFLRQLQNYPSYVGKKVSNLVREYVSTWRYGWAYCFRRERSFPLRRAVAASLRAHQPAKRTKPEEEISYGTRRDNRAKIAYVFLLHIRCSAKEKERLETHEYSYFYQYNIYFIFCRCGPFLLWRSDN